MARKANPGKGAFARCVKHVSEKGTALDPRAVCAAAGRRKYGAKKFAAMARAGKKRAARARRNYSTAKRYRIWAQVSGGVTGSRAAWLKSGGKIMEFATREAAQREADHLNETMGKDGGRARFSYTVSEANPPKSHYSQKDLISIGKAAVAAKVAPWMLLNKGKRKNPGDSAEDAYREFHGRDPEDRIEFETVHHYPGKTAALGDLVSLDLRIPAGRGVRNRIVHLSDFGQAWLTRHPKMKQLYVEGGDQSVDLKVFGLDDKDFHEIEYLGELAHCVYFTRKDHLGDEGGEAEFHHRFGRHELKLKRTELIKVGYHVPDEQLIFMGGGYEIPPEGIDG